MKGLERSLRETLQRRAYDVAPDPIDALRVFRRARRARIATAAGLVAVVAVGIAGIAAVTDALPGRLEPGPGVSVSLVPSTSPWPDLDPCPVESARCGSRFSGDLDGDDRPDDLALIVTMDDEQLPIAAELLARLATGDESSILIEAEPAAGTPQLVPGTYLADPGTGVVDLDGDGRDEVPISIAQSGAGRVFVRLYAWTGDALAEVSAAGEDEDSPRRVALRSANATISDSFEFILGGSAGFGGGLRCEEVSGRAERELVLWFYSYGDDGHAYVITEATYDLEDGSAVQGEVTSTTVPADRGIEGDLECRAGISSRKNDP